LHEHEVSLFGYSSETLTHEEITRRGIIKSVVNYFYDQPHGRDRIDLNKINEYYNLFRLYNDYYNRWYCKIELHELIENVFQKNVINVDFASNTKDLPIGKFNLIY
jgi:hypothetical protein